MSAALRPRRALPSAPNWLIPMPWPKPLPSNRAALVAGSTWTVKRGDGISSGSPSGAGWLPLSRLTKSDVPTSTRPPPAAPPSEGWGDEVLVVLALAVVLVVDGPSCGAASLPDPLPAPPGVVVSVVGMVDDDVLLVVAGSDGGVGDAGAGGWG